MEKIALVADSTCDLNHEEIKKNNVHILPLKIIYGSREYTDGVDITPEEVYKNMGTELPTTSLPSAESIQKLFNSLRDEGYTHVIVISISSGLSGTYNTLRLISEDYPEMKFEIFDSRALSLGAGAIVLECAQMIEKRKSFTEIVSEMPRIRDSIKVYFVVGTLKYLIEGGRIGKVSGSIGEILKVKPIISINEEGIYYTYKKVRGRKQSIAALYDIAIKTLENNKAKIWIMHGGAKEEAEEIYEKISKIGNVEETGFGNISPVAGVHTGPGLIGMVIMTG